MPRRFIRLAETERQTVSIEIDGKRSQALEGDTLLIALLSNVGHVRASEFDDGPRAGFCLMGACQDCWVSTVSGKRLRACSTIVVSGMQIVTDRSEATWSTRV
jgi:predicted molibdopterin-dependent oxidoreductase YjgC